MKTLNKYLIITLVLLLSAGSVFGAAGRNVLVQKQLGVGYAYAEIEGSPLQNLLLGIPSSMTITSCTNSTTVSSAIATTDIGGLDADLFESNFVTPGCMDFVLYIPAVDDADGDTIYVGDWRAIQSVTITGDSITFTVVPAFTDAAGTGTLDAGDEIMVLPFRAVNPNTRQCYVGTVASGGSGTAVFKDLIGRPYGILVGASVYCINDLSATTNDNKKASVTEFASTSGQVTFVPAHTPAVGDQYMIIYDRGADLIEGVDGAHTSVTPHAYGSGYNVMEVLAKAQVAADSADVCAEFLRDFVLPNWSKTSSLAGTAAADSLTCFTVGSEADIYMLELGMDVTAGAGATSELANFVIVNGTSIVRFGEGKNLNNLAAGVEQWASPLTAVWTDSLKYVRSSSCVLAPVLEIIPWKLRLPAGSVIKLLLPGSSTTTRVTVHMKWQPAEGTLPSVTAG